MTELNVKNIFSICRKLSFGAVSLCRDEEDLYKILNNQKINLCRSLPPSMQNRAIMFLMEYSGLKTGDALDFFKNYYKPVWTIIYHIAKKFEGARALSEDEMEAALKGQAMSLFLHSLDDHLNDGQIKASHLALLLRTAAWTRMAEAVESFSEKNQEYRLTAHNLIDEYYKGVSSPHPPQNFEQYCLRFAKEISTIYIMPVLTAKKLGCENKFIGDIKKCIASFGLAWRLIDDVNDLEDDIKQGERSGVYYCLPGRGRSLWDGAGGKGGRSAECEASMERLSEIIIEKKIIEDITARIAEELTGASAIAEKHGMTELARQYSDMKSALKPEQKPGKDRMRTKTPCSK